MAVYLTKILDLNGSIPWKYYPSNLMISPSDLGHIEVV